MGWGFSAVCTDRIPFLSSFSSSVKLWNGSAPRPTVPSVVTAVSVRHAREVSTKHQVFPTDHRDIEQTLACVQSSGRSLRRDRTISARSACLSPRLQINWMESFNRSWSNCVRTRHRPSETVRKNLVLHVHTRCCVAHEGESQGYVKLRELSASRIAFVPRLEHLLAFA